MNRVYCRDLEIQKGRRVERVKNWGQGDEENSGDYQVAQHVELADGWSE